MPRVTTINQPFGGALNRAGDHLIALLSRSSERFDNVRTRVPTGSGYDYDATIISRGHPMFNAFLGSCVNTVVQSGKWWGYS